MSRWSSAGPHCRTNTGYWLELCAEVDWMFRSAGLDTADIAEHLGMHEAVVARALSQARAARRDVNGGSNVPSEVGSTAKTNAGGGSVA